MTRFQQLQTQITQIGLEHHRETIVQNSIRNARYVRKTIRDIKPDPRPCLVISAGPSLQRAGILGRLKFSGKRPLIVCADGAYIQCLKAGIIPDWVVTLDPSPRIVRWFGQRFEDEYFQRQDLDITIREEQENVALVDANKVPLVICTTSPQNVVERTKDFDRYWFAPLVDDPATKGSITARICESTKAPGLNTGGTIGTLGVIFTKLSLASQSIAVVGTDFGYYADTPLEKTQEWNMLKSEKDVHDFYPVVNGHWGAGYTSPTYEFYRRNLMDLLEANNVTITNCSGGGFLRGRNVICEELEEWLDRI